MDAQGGFDLGKLKEALHPNLQGELEHGCCLDFIGKTYARKQASAQADTLIVPDVEHNEKPENAKSENLFFTGDNLDVLRHLKNNYYNSVDLIYIDPPYNTGSDDFVYPDKFEWSEADLKEEFGMSDVQIKRLKTLQGRSSHSAWLAFMYPRLFIARQLLKDSGVIFVSIDDNEQAHLKLLLDEVFGEGNCLGINFTVNNRKGRSDDEFFATAGEFLTCYAKDTQNAKINGLPPDEEYIREFNKEDDFGKYKLVSLQKTGKNSRKIDRPNMYYPIYYRKNTQEFSLKKDEDTIEIFPAKINGVDGCWRWGKETLEENMGSELEAREVNGIWRIYVKMRLYIDGELRTIRPKTIWEQKSYDTGAGSRRVQELLGSKTIFSNPKPPNYLIDILRCGCDENALILDFFAGSGTTADAVMQLNAEDGGKRKFILVQLPEVCKEGSVAKKNGYETIDEITRERVKRSAAKILEEKQSEMFFKADEFDGGFKHFRVKNPPDNYIGNIKSINDAPQMFSTITQCEGGAASILATWMAMDGFKFDIPVKVEEFAGCVANVIEDVLYILEMWSSEATEELINRLGTYDEKLVLRKIVVAEDVLTFEKHLEIKNELKRLKSGSGIEVALEVRN